MLPIRIEADKLDVLFEGALANVGYKLKIDLEQQTISAPDASVYNLK